MGFRLGCKKGRGWGVGFGGFPTGGWCWLLPRWGLLTVNHDHALNFTAANFTCCCQIVGYFDRDRFDGGHFDRIPKKKYYFA